MKLKTLMQPQPPIIDCIWLNTNDNIEYIRKDGRWIPLHSNSIRREICILNEPSGEGNNNNNNNQNTQNGISKEDADRLYQKKGDYVDKNSLSTINGNKIYEGGDIQINVPEIDKTLTLPDYAADAHEVGKQIDNLKRQIDLIPGGLNIKGSISSKNDLPDDKSKNDTYFCEEDNSWYFWNGDSWVSFGGGFIEDKINITTTTKVGGIEANTRITDKTPAQILIDMLTPYIKPSITKKSISQSIMLYGKTYSNVSISVTARKGSEAIKDISIDKTKYTVSDSSLETTKTKILPSVSNLDDTQSELTYDISVSDSKNNTVSDSISVPLTEGVFMFFNRNSSINTDIELDFTDYGCQGELTSIDGQYSLSHDSLEYLYILAPLKDKFKIKSIKSGIGDVPYKKISNGTFKQGENGTFCDVTLAIYRTEERQQPGTINFQINPK